MKNSISTIPFAAYFILGASLFWMACNSNNKVTKQSSSVHKGQSMQQVLVFTKTAGFRHSCISDGLTALKKLGEEGNFEITQTENSQDFTDENLETYQAIIFFNTTGDVLNENQEKSFKKYIQSGGGFVGVHSATDTEYEWEWYGKLVGGYFKNHPKIQKANFIVEDQNFAASSFLPAPIWTRKDELYNFKNLNPNTNVILSVDESSYEGGENGKNHPMAWYHEYDGGRAFYTALGHTHESYEEPLFLRHLLEGIRYALGR